MKPIYTPGGRALEYSNLALNIYTGCPHGCTYCYAAKNAKRWGKDFTDVKPRAGIVEATKRQLERASITGQLIHLCFTCDPYPQGHDCTATREIIKAIKNSGNHVQILTKNGLDAKQDIDLLDENDWFGVTFTGLDHPNVIEPDASDFVLSALTLAYSKGIKTWASCEPVLNTEKVLMMIAKCSFIDKIKIGKLNHYTPEDFGLKPINWGEFGRKAEWICKEWSRDYVIKDDLRREME